VREQMKSIKWYGVVSDDCVSCFLGGGLMKDEIDFGGNFRVGGRRKPGSPRLWRVVQ